VRVSNQVDDARYVLQSKRGPVFAIYWGTINLRNGLRALMKCVVTEGKRGNQTYRLEGKVREALAESREALRRSGNPRKYFEKDKAKIEKYLARRRARYAAGKTL
jgi:hypothetical protein